MRLLLIQPDNLHNRTRHFDNTVKDLHLLILLHNFQAFHQTRVYTHDIVRVIKIIDGFSPDFDHIR